MIIIGEKINGAIPSVGSAIAAKDTGFIAELAKKQVEAGVDYLDICAGTLVAKEYDTLCWLLDIVQEYTETPICIDSPDPRMIERVLPRIRKTGIINSVSGEGEKCDVLYPILKDNDWDVVVLTCDDNGIPGDADSKVKIASGLIDKALGYGIAVERLHVDPLVMSVATVHDAVLVFMEASQRIKEAYPGIHIAAGLSNVSYGLPCRTLINQGFLTLALSAGLDTGIIDPLNRGLRGAMLAAEVLLDKDRHCRRYNNAYRSGKIGTVI